MEKLVKVTNENYPNLYNVKLDKYLFINSSNQVLGTAIIDDAAQSNKIKVDILEEYRGNGYGESIFNEALKEYRATHNDNELRFEIESQNNFKRILHKFGSINIANKNGKLIYILPLKI